MADIYKVVYEKKNREGCASLQVSATSQANAWAAVQTADPKATQPVSITAHGLNIIVGS